MSQRGQRGQTLPIFALASLVIIGTVALAVDFGFLANQHRNLQAFADEASTAGALKLGQNPGPSEYTAARKAAFIYLRDNLGLVSTVHTTDAGKCYSDFGNQIGTAGTPDCVLGTSTYKVSIWSPGDTVPGGQDPALARTVSVRITESVTTALAGLFAFNQVPVGAYSLAQTGPGLSNYALWSDGCVRVTSGKAEVMGGDAYINECTLKPNGGAFCTYTANATGPRGRASTGTATYGPYATLPATIVPVQTVAGCTGAAAGSQAATGNILQSGREQPPPQYAPPPGIPMSASPGVAAHSSLCKNGTKNAAGVAPSTCYDPGAYSTIGLSSPIANNLNPGVYHIYGDTSSGNGCYNSVASIGPPLVPADINCVAVLFGDNTFNANRSDTIHQCWNAPNVPSTGTFTTPCPDGFIDNPTFGITDPQCAPGCPLVALTPPTFSLTASAVGGSLDPARTGTIYYVRVTAYNSFGESLSSEVAVNVVSPLSTGSITVAITGASPGATGYHVYGPSTLPGLETLNGVSLTTTASLTVPAVGGITFPLFDSSACPGFCNQPGEPTTSSNQYGVTFVLEGKASVCIGVLNPDGVHCDDTSTSPTVLLSPYCASGFTQVASAGNPSHTFVCNQPSAFTTDGTFVFYGPTEGTIRTGSQGAALVFGFSGVIDTPRAFLDIDEGKFHGIPAQVIVHNVDIDSSNALDPLIYFGLGPPPPIQVRLLQ